jgi:fluoride ion exporter CrcB/FEX
MFEDGDWIQATVYVSASVLGGLLLVRTGMRLAKMV